jgi:hypothetical protein
MQIGSSTRAPINATDPIATPMKGAQRQVEGAASPDHAKPTDRLFCVIAPRSRSSGQVS